MIVRVHSLTDAHVMKKVFSLLNTHGQSRYICVLRESFFWIVYSKKLAHNIEKKKALSFRLKIRVYQKLRSTSGFFLFCELIKKER